jgi:hypothetical protein
VPWARHPPGNETDVETSNRQDSPGFDARQGPHAATAPLRAFAGRSRRKLRQHLALYIEYGGDLLYPTFAAAAKALCLFIAASRLPIPTIVDTDTTGTGITDTTGIAAFWWFDEPLAAAAWEKAARRLQRRCRRQGLWSDVGDLSYTVRPPAAAHLLVEGDRIDPRPALAVRLPRRRRW